MQITSAKIPAVKILKPVRHLDPRGFLAEVFRIDILQQHGIDTPFVQENQSLSVPRGIVRGLHFQIPPAAQARLVRVTAGAIFAVAVDLRAGSPSYGRHVAAMLSASDGLQMFVPEGFAHGYCAMEAKTEIAYKMSSYYSASHDRGVRWDDPALAIQWPIPADTALVSERDRRLPLLAALPRHFE
jgi:dTDP-4-dehydrorhamnose 3,5-epimerase